MKTNPNAPNFDSAIEYLNNGKIVIYPTETLYGMGVDAQNENAIQYLFRIKKRELSKPVSILLPNKKTVSEYCKKISPVAQALIGAFWPGPLTIILKCDAFPKGVRQDGKVGFRVSSNPLVQNLLLKFNKCITTTSANIANKESPMDPVDFFRIFPKDSFILIQEIKPSKPTRPSTVVDCSGDGYEILREGPVSDDDIRAVFKKSGLT